MRQADSFSIASPAVSWASSLSEGDVVDVGVGSGEMIAALVAAINRVDVHESAAQVGGMAAASGEAMKRAATQIINGLVDQGHRWIQWPWYAASMPGALASAFGDVEIDPHLHVRHNSGDPIPDLYAAGNSTCGVECGSGVGDIGGLIKALASGLPCAHDLVQARRPSALQ